MILNASPKFSLILISSTVNVDSRDGILIVRKPENILDLLLSYSAFVIKPKEEKEELRTPTNGERTLLFSSIAASITELETLTVIYFSSRPK